MPKIRPYLLSLYIARVYAQKKVRLVLEFRKEAHLDVGIIARQDPGRVVVVKELSAKFKIELVVEPFYAFQDLRVCS